MQFPRPRSWWIVARVAALALVGAIAGFTWWAKVGCPSGGCPITSNPFLMTGLGAAFGLTFGWPSDGLFLRAGAVPEPGPEAGPTP